MPLYLRQIMGYTIAVFVTSLCCIAGPEIVRWYSGRLHETLFAILTWQELWSLIFIWLIAAAIEFFMMFFPWYAILALATFFRRTSPAYFMASGASAAFVVGCAIAFLSGHSFDSPEQSVSSNILAALKVCALWIAPLGAVGGFIYWLIAEHGQTQGASKS